MIDQDLEPIAADLRELLDAERAVPALAPEVSARLAARVAGTLGLPPVPPTAPAPSTPPPAHAAHATQQAGAQLANGAAHVATKAIAAWTVARIAPLLLTYAAGGLTGAMVVLNVVDRDAPRAPHAPVEARTTEPSVAAVPSAPIPTVDEPALPTSAAPPLPNGPGMEPPQPKRASVASARELPSAHVGHRDLGDRDLGAERHLIELARAALARGRADEALTALERHARRFPKGRLVEERESMRIATLVVRGRNDEAKRLAARFQARYPTSLFAPIVQQALQSIP